jgi:predicted transcriptional regulator
MRTATLEDRALKLEPRDRVRLAQLLLESLYGLSEEEIAAIRRSAERLALQKAVEEAERSIAAGEWVEHGEISAKLRRWAGGEP